MVGSGWFIDDIELPIAPLTDNRSITRKFQSETLFQFFPKLVKSNSAAYDYTITGYIYPLGKAFALNEIAKSADTATVVLRIPPSSDYFNSGQYAIKKLTIERKGPLWIKTPDDNNEGLIDTQALPFTLTVSELPDEGVNEEGIDGFLNTDESGLGLEDLNELLDDYAFIGPRRSLVPASSIEAYHEASGEQVQI